MKTSNNAADQITKITPIIKKKVFDLTESLIIEQLTPWRFLHSGKPFKVARYIGKPIMYEGARFEGIPQKVFWNGFIEPFLENRIEQVLKEVAKICLESNLQPEPYIKEAMSFLYGMISRVYDEMARIDRNLRGKGYPQNVKLRNVQDEIDKMERFLKERAEAEIFLATSQLKAKIAKTRPANAHESAETGGNATSAKGWGITTLFKNIIEKGWQIFTKSFWDSVFERLGPK